MTNTTIRRIMSVVDNINDCVGKIVRFGLLFMAGFLFFEVISRYFFNRPTIWVYDLSRQDLALMALLGGGYTILYNCNVRVDVIYEHLKPRMRAIMDLITSVFFFAFAIVLLKEGWVMAADSWRIKELANTIWHPPLYWIKMALPIGTLLLLLQGVVQFIHNIFQAVSGVEEPTRTIDFN